MKRSKTLLRAILSEVFFTKWNKSIDDMSDAFYTNYTFGADIAVTGDFDPAAQATSSPMISADIVL